MPIQVVLTQIGETTIIIKHLTNQKTHTAGGKVTPARRAKPAIRARSKLSGESNY